MKNPMAWLLVVAVVAFGIASFVYFSAAMDPNAWPDARTPALVAGIICVSLSAALLVVGLILFRKRD